MSGIKYMRVSAKFLADAASYYLNSGHVGEPFETRFPVLNVYKVHESDLFTLDLEDGDDGDDG